MLERLTKRMVDTEDDCYALCGNVILAKCEDCVDRKPSCYEPDCSTEIEALTRLAAYEDSGLTPDEVERLKVLGGEAFIELQSYKKSGLSPEEIQELGKAKKEGSLVVLPCKVGDTVYAVAEREIVQCKIIEITLKEGGISFVRLYSTDDRIADYRYDNFVKTVFLTREEAEKAMGEY